MLDQITPVVLTRNESPNIARTLAAVAWARDIVVVDSESDDDTLTLAGGFPQARIFSRRFDSHAQQWQFAIDDTGIGSEWVLALDADYVLDAPLVDELRDLAPPPGVTGFEARFLYCIRGHALRGGLYPSHTVLFRRQGARFVQDGHTQRLLTDGAVLRLDGYIRHDDRKPLAAWLTAQARYARLEAEKLHCMPKDKAKGMDALRRARWIAPLLMPFYCLVVKGLALEGWRGMYYAMQRTYAEALISLFLLEAALLRKDARSPPVPGQGEEPPST
ncbi:MAG: glycosyltransferase family 2 protein [Betaproteobacteria bacterium]